MWCVLDYMQAHVVYREACGYSVRQMCDKTVLLFIIHVLVEAIF